MSDCSYCGKPAGLFHHVHAECEASHASATAKILSTAEAALSASPLNQSLAIEVNDAASSGFVGPEEKIELLVRAWRSALDKAIDAGVLEESKQDEFIQFLKAFGITKERANVSHAFDRLVKAVALRDVMHGQVPTQFHSSVPLPFNFQKTEQLVWAVKNCEYLEDKTRREYVGRGGGFSVRIAKGLYYHTSSFKGHPVDRTERTHIDTGWFAVTNKNLYFAGDRKSERIPFPKIVSFQSFTDGLGIVRDAASAKPKFFLTGDGWFSYNLVTNLAKL